MEIGDLVFGVQVFEVDLYGVVCVLCYCCEIWVGQFVCECFDYDIGDVQCVVDFCMLVFDYDCVDCLLGCVGVDFWQQVCECVQVVDEQVNLLVVFVCELMCDVLVYVDVVEIVDYCVEQVVGDWFVWCEWCGREWGSGGVWY